MAIYNGEQYNVIIIHAHRYTTEVSNSNEIHKPHFNLLCSSKENYSIASTRHELLYMYLFLRCSSRSPTLKLKLIEGYIVNNV